MQTPTIVEMVFDSLEQMKCASAQDGVERSRAITLLRRLLLGDPPSSENGFVWWKEEEMLATLKVLQAAHDTVDSESVNAIALARAIDLLQFLAMNSIRRGGSTDSDSAHWCRYSPPSTH